MPHASRHKLTPADGGGDRKRLFSLGSEIACKLSLTGFLIVNPGSTSVVLQNPSRDELGKMASLAAVSATVHPVVC